MIEDQASSVWLPFSEEGLESAFGPRSTLAILVASTTLVFGVRYEKHTKAISISFFVLLLAHLHRLKVNPW